MFVRKTSLPRRTFLRGLGVAAGLPFLEAMVPAFTAMAQTPARPQMRLGFVYFPNGAIMSDWIPKSGDGFEFSPTLKPLEPFADRLVVIGNLARAGTTIGDHAVAAAGWLTGVYAKKTEAEDVLAGTTIDQIVARRIGNDTPFRSLEYATEDFTGYIGGCTPGFSCTYMNTISWSSPTTALPMEIDPRSAFERLFGRSGTADQRAARLDEDRSILDSISADANRLRTKLGARDRARIDQYLDGIREIERRIHRSASVSKDRKADMDAPAGIPESFEEHAAVMGDLLAIAWQADLTRVFTFMMCREASQRTYPQIGVTEPHHTISHHANDPRKIASNAKINVYHAELFSRFLKKLAATPDGDGSLLDHSLVFYGGGMGDGNAHATDPLPLVAVGGGAGKGHRHILPPPKTPVANFWIGIADKFGVKLDSFGNSTGRVDL
jgi:Protein of unknown function (DUF1552)